MDLLLGGLLLLLQLPPWATALECESDAARPIALPLRDVLVDSGISDSYMRGIPAKVGTPPQDIVMLPWAELNNTWIYDGQHSCSAELNLTDTTCRVRRGSYFRPGDSQTFLKMADIVAAGGAAKEITTKGTELDVGSLVSTSLGGSDLLTVGDGDGGPAAVDIMPIGMPRLNWDHGYTTLHTLGLGSNSTFLINLVKAGKIPSRVWSLFWGRVGGPNTMDGSVILGGYDREKVTGRNYTQRLDYSDASGCWTGMKITVSAIEANFWNGANENVLDGPLSVCIVPQRQHLLEAPSPVLDKFNTVTSMRSNETDEGLQWFDQILSSGFPTFDGDVTFVIGSSLRIRIPNNQYIIPFTTFDDQGHRVVNNTKKVLVMSHSGPNPATIGRWFFTGAVLMVDYGAGTFTLWQANPSSRSDLVAVAGEGGKSLAARTSTNCTVGGAGGEIGAGDGGVSGTNNAAVAAGAVVGGVAGLVVVAGGVFWLVRQTQRKRLMTAAAAQETTAVAGSKAYRDSELSKMMLVSEFAGRGYTGTPPAAEMLGNPSHGVVPPGGQKMSGYTVYEMDAQGRGGT